MSLSVVIPSRDPRFLQKTVDDVLRKAHGLTEVIVVLDGYEVVLHPHPQVQVIQFDQHRGMRAAINAGMEVARGECVMKLDEHCLMAEGFDLELAYNSQLNWVVIPRRYRLDPVKWEVIADGRPPIDYMRLQEDPGYIHGVKWHRPERADPEFDIDDTPAFQGSCWFMYRQLWRQIAPMDDAAYGPFANEAQEIASKVLAPRWNGRVVVNKRTWYAHWHKGQAGTGYGFTHEQQEKFEADKQRGRANFAQKFEEQHEQRAG